MAKEWKVEYLAKNGCITLGVYLLLLFAGFAVWDVVSGGSPCVDGTVYTSAEGVVSCGYTNWGLHTPQLISAFGLIFYPACGLFSVFVLIVVLVVLYSLVRYLATKSEKDLVEDWKWS